jgi:AcrR family transcriptional regulator
MTNHLQNEPHSIAAADVMPADQRLIDPQALEKLRLTVIDLFAQGLFQHIGMREIAKRAKVGLATIYKYFGNKDELVFACIHQDLEHLSHLLKVAYDETETLSSEQQIKACLKEMVTFYLDHRQIAEIVYLNIPTRVWVSETHPMQVQQVTMVRGLIERGQLKREIRTDQPLEVMVQLTLGAIFRYLVAYLLGQLPQKSPESVSTEIFECLWPMIKHP